MHPFLFGSRFGKIAGTENQGRLSQRIDSNTEIGALALLLA